MSRCNGMYCNYFSGPILFCSILINIEKERSSFVFLLIFKQFNTTEIAFIKESSSGNQAECFVLFPGPPLSLTLIIFVLAYLPVKTTDTKQHYFHMKQNYSVILFKQKMRSREETSKYNHLNRALSFLAFLSKNIWQKIS